MADVKKIIRLMNTDLNGEKALKISLRKIKGVGATLAQVICKIAKLDPTTKAGSLDEKQIKTIEDLIKSLPEHVPVWMLNRQNDYETGENKHLVMGDIKYIQGNDKTRLGRIRSYRGLRLAQRLTVRGQRTRSNFRKHKIVVMRKR